MNIISKNITQQELKSFVDEHVFACQSALVEKLFEKEIVLLDEVVNLYRPFRAFWNKISGLYCDKCDNRVNVIDAGTLYCKECFEANQELQEIFEWWLVSDFLLDKLEAHGQPVLKTEFGKWWGRTTTGQAIYIDCVIEEIYREVH